MRVYFDDDSEFRPSVMSGPGGTARLRLFGEDYREAITYVLTAKQLAKLRSTLNVFADRQPAELGDNFAYDYDKQAWVRNGRYVRCGHPEDMACGCYGRQHEGEEAIVEANAQ